ALGPYQGSPRPHRQDRSFYLALPIQAPPRWGGTRAPRQAGADPDGRSRRPSDRRGGGDDPPPRTRPVSRLPATTPELTSEGSFVPENLTHHNAPQAGLEPAHPAPEAGALSTELLGLGSSPYRVFP